MKRSRTQVDATTLVEDLLTEAVGLRASDLHFEPMADDYLVRCRVDGLLRDVTRLPTEAGRSAVHRLMVLAQLLTYRMDVPQEGHMSLVLADRDQPRDLRVSVIPTTHGIRGVVRLPVDQSQPRTLAELGLPTAVLDGLTGFVDADEGMLLLSGPAGSGKSTTIYALLAEITRLHPGLSVIALEDPVERDLPGVTQIQIQPFGELTYERALRSILRQDPEVLMLGEIRDSDSAAIAVQAALSGHRLISTLHAGTACGAITRLLEMDIEPYQITSALYGAVAQRLLRTVTPDGEYVGRAAVASFARMDGAMRQAVLDRGDTDALEAIAARQGGFQTLAAAARAAVEQGVTDAAEVRRVLGPSAVH